MPGNVDPEDLMTVLQAHINGIMDELGSLAEGDQLEADDLLEFFAIATGAVLANDSEIRTPRDIRLAGEAMGKLIAQRASDLREFGEQTGMSALDAIRSGVPIYAGKAPFEG